MLKRRRRERKKEFDEVIIDTVVDYRATWPTLKPKLEKKKIHSKKTSLYFLKKSFFLFRGTKLSNLKSLINLISLVRIQFNFYSYFIEYCTVWLKVVQRCGINLVSSYGVCFLMQILVKISYFLWIFFEICHFENLFTLNL